VVKNDLNEERETGPWAQSPVSEINVLL